ncbi:60S ribosomal protein L30 [Cichlidogyrus casuarinus]|uniref:Large ribosomal subunit protein eL30 n=1 Tax=Cichlidogyrus casuarinus TaxID=1844966 RepID=A0ABD2Q918_9PLAT
MVATTKTEKDTKKEGASKVVTKKTKALESINGRLAMVMKTGKAALGVKSSIVTLRKGSAQLIIIANNTPPLRRTEIEYYAMLAKCGVHNYNGDNTELGSACGKYFGIGCMAITDAGDSDIVRSTEA